MHAVPATSVLKPIPNATSLSISVLPPSSKFGGNSLVFFAIKIVLAGAKSRVKRKDRTGVEDSR